MSEDSRKGFVAKLPVQVSEDRLNFVLPLIGIVLLLFWSGCATEVAPSIVGMDELELSRIQLSNEPTAETIDIDELVDAFILAEKNGTEIQIYNSSDKKIIISGNSMTWKTDTIPCNPNCPDSNNFFCYRPCHKENSNEVEDY